MVQNAKLQHVIDQLQHTTTIIDTQRTQGNHNIVQATDNLEQRAKQLSARGEFHSEI